MTQRLLSGRWGLGLVALVAAAGAVPGTASPQVGASGSASAASASDTTGSVIRAIDQAGSEPALVITQVPVLFALSQTAGSLAGVSQPAGAVQSSSSPDAAKSLLRTTSTTGEQIRQGIRSSFAFPIRDLYDRKHESLMREMLDGLTIAPGLQMPFNARAAGAGDTGALLSGSPALTLDLLYRPVGYWFAQLQLLAYLEPSKRAPWNGDFVYSFGYDDYHPYTLSLVYSNYTNNRFDPRPGDPITRLARGTITLGWKAPLPQKWAEALLFDKRLTINCRIGLNVSPRYDQDDGGVGEWKQSANLSCRYPFTSLWFLDLNLFAYGRGQQPWDPDFTYAFGLADFRSGRFSILYANYSGNRFPGRRRAANTGTFADGGLFINWNRQF